MPNDSFIYFRTLPMCFSCCKMHDWCYDTADCPMFLEYFTPYVWTCYNKKPLCCEYCCRKNSSINASCIITTKIGIAAGRI